jgi:hypothetical protein
MGRAHTLKGLRVDEVSLVDAPANPGALHVLFKRRDATMDVDPIIKRTFSADQRKELAASGAALPDGSFPIENTADLHNAIKAVGRASDPDKAKAHIKSRARALGATASLPDEWKGAKAADGPLDRLLNRLGLRKNQPADIDPDRYADAAAAAVDQATDALGKSIRSILADAAVTDKAEAIGKSLAEFRGYLGDAMPEQIEKAMRDVALAGVEIEKDNTMPTLEEVTATNAELQKRLAAAEFEVAVAKMSAKHKAHMDKLKTDDAKAKFAAKSTDDRNKEVDAAEPDADDSDTAKRLKKALADTEDLQKRLAVFEADKELISFQKRAREIGIAEAQAETILKASKGDGTAFQAVLDMIKAANAQARTGTLFKEFGAAGGMPPAGGVARAEVEQKAETLRKADPKLSVIAARVQVRKADPDLAQRERDEERAAVRAVS